MNAYKKFGYYYDEVMSQLNYDLWVEFVEPYLKKDDSILDLACGTATFITMLKLKGYDVCGLDLSQTILEIASEKMKINHLDFPLYNMDMKDFKLNKKFDVITCFFDSINFLASLDDVKKMFNTVLNQKDFPTDDCDRIRMDSWELDDKVQDACRKLWPQITTENLKQLTDYENYKKDFLKLFGFELSGVDYSQDVNPEVNFEVITL